MYNLNAYNTLNLTGTPSFLLAAPNNNSLVINSLFGKASGAINLNNLIIGDSVSNFSTRSNNCTHIGYNIQVESSDLSSNQTTLIGQTLRGAFYRDTQIGYLHNKIKDTIGENVSIGYSIGGTEGAGCRRRSVAIGSSIFNQYNGFNRRKGGLEAVAIGYSSQQNCADGYNTSVGSYSLQNINGNGGAAGETAVTTQYNTAFGWSAGKNNAGMNNCTFIGALSDSLVNSIINASALGYNTKASANYATALGYNAYASANYATSIGADVSNNIPNSVKIGRSSDTIIIDGSLNVAGILILPNNSIPNSALSYDVFKYNQSQDSTISSGTSLAYPLYSAYSVNAGASAFTITLPTITSLHLGEEILFRRVGGTTTTIVSFVGNGTQNIYDTGLTGGSTAQPLMGSGVYAVKLVSLVDGTSGTFAWFQI